MKKELKYQPPKKSVGEQMMEDLFTIAIVSFIIYVICGFFKILFYPVTWLFKTSRELHEEDIQKALQKKQAREQYLLQIRSDPNDPMNVYLERFTENPEEYKGDPLNDDYLEWYLHWRNGDILDSRMRWAPDVYVKINGKNTINGEFARYLEIQYELHKEAGWASRHCFLQTIRKYFPEVTPKMSVMWDDIEALKDRAKTRELKAELSDEIRKFGISEEVSEQLCNQNISGKEIMKKARVIKKCIERGYSQSASLFIANQGYKPDSEKAEGANELLNNGCPDFVAEEYIEGNITDEETKGIARFMKAAIELYGERIYDIGSSGDTLLREAIRERLDEVKAEHRKKEIEEKAGRAAWQ